VTKPTTGRPLATRDERAGIGAAARDRTPPPALAPIALEARADPLGILAAQDRTRLPDLVPIRYGRMSASPFAFLRGSAADSGISTQLCGDAHVANFGVFAGPDRRLLFDINDFDETNPGPFEWDVKRLAASIVVAARDRGDDPRTARGATLGALARYREEIARLATTDPLATRYGRIEFEELLPRTEGQGRKVAEKVAKKARRRTSLKALDKLTEVVDGRRRIVADPPLLVPARDVPRVQDAERVAAFFSAYRDSLRDDVRVLLDRFAYVDFALKVVGVGSVGTRALVVLLQDGDGVPLFLQCKEAGGSVLEPFTQRSVYENGGRRVVEGQRLMQAASDIFLGWSHDAHTGTAFYFRQLRDMKGGVETRDLDAQRFAGYVQLCAATLARAHARGGDAATIAGYLGDDDAFDTAVTDWAEAYADVTERDHAALAQGIEDGTIDAVVDV
jgi:uncharacterized protein (DUF2252 family)